MRSVIWGFSKTLLAALSIVVAGCGGGSTTTSIATTNGPTAPTALNITPGTGKLTLVWSSTNTGAMYHVYCDQDATKPNANREIRLETANTTIEITNLTDGLKYFCAVTASKNSTESAAAVSSATVGAAQHAMPMPPVNIVATPGDKQVLVQWEAIAGATAYRVYYSTVSGVSKTTTTTIPTTTNQATIPNLTNDTTVYFVVTTFIGTEESDASAQKSATPSATATTLPAAPQTLTAVANGVEINLTWSASTGATSYAVYWGAQSNFTPVATQRVEVTNGNLTYTHTGLTPTTTYYYLVKAKNAIGESTAGAAANATTTTATDTVLAPTNPTASISGNIMTVTWTAAAGATGYHVYYAKQPGVTTSTITKKPNVTGTTTNIDLTDLALTNGNLVYYRVTAYKTVNQINRESAPTGEQSVTFGTNTTPVNGNAKRGALLYDNWMATKGVAAPVNDHPLWNTRAFNGGNYYNQTKGANTWRCIECHGSDYKGRDGFYGLNTTPSKYTGFIGLATSTKMAADIVAFLKQGGSTSNHGFISPAYLNDADFSDIAVFLTTIATGSADNTLTGGSSLSGEKLFFVEGKNEAGTAVPTCGNSGCHKGDYEELRVTELAAHDPYAFLHRVRFGADGGKIMTETMSLQQTKDAYAYVNNLLRSTFEPLRYYSQSRHLDDFNRGKTLYKDWVSTKAGAVTLTAKHELWPTTNTNAAITTEATWRCESCHGIDLLGVDGMFKQGHEYFTDIRGVVSPEAVLTGTTYQAQFDFEIFDFIRSAMPAHTNYGTAHAFGHYLNNDDNYGLTRYISLMRGIDTISYSRAISLGARLYDNFWAQKNITPAANLQKNPVWVGAVDQTNDPTTVADSWRCTTCHGWNYIGKDGDPSLITRGITNETLSFNEYKTRTALTALIRDSKKTVQAPDGSTATTTITGHEFGSFLQAHEIDALVDFVLEVRKSVADGTPITLREKSTASDQTNYTLPRGNCVNCHGSDGKANNTNIVAAAKNNRFMFLHRVRFGAPGSAMMPSIDGFQGLTDIEAVRLLRFIETKAP